MRLAFVLGVVGIAAALPGVASAHVGRTLPVATDFVAHITSSARGVEARAVDGDQTLWLRAAAGATVLVPGTLGEPLLRFDSHGVWLNLRSPTAQGDGIDRLDLRPSAKPDAAPLWHRVAGGQAYAWHEHRLHALEALARGRSSAETVGPWTVPVVVDGRRLRLTGVLDYRPPGPGWARIAASAVTAAAAAALALRSRLVLVALAVAAVALIWVLRVGRELYGRPNVPTIGYVQVGLTSLVGCALLYGLLNLDARVLATFLVGFGGLYEGLTMLPLLTHAIALNALPSTVARVVEALVLATGIGALGGSIFGPLREAT